MSSAASVSGNSVREDRRLANSPLRHAVSTGVKPRKAPVTSSMTWMCDGAGGTGGGGGAIGMSNVEGIKATNACTCASSLSSLLCTTLESGHLCLLARLQDLNFHPHASHWHSRGGSLAAFAASLSRSHLATQLCFHARHCFSFWALLALWLPFWSSKKAM